MKMNLDSHKQRKFPRPFLAEDRKNKVWALTVLMHDLMEAGEHGKHFKKEI